MPAGDSIAIGPARADCTALIHALDLLAFTRLPMKRIAPLLLLILSTLQAQSAYSAPPSAATPGLPVAEINTREGLALRGYDAVSYFMDGKPQMGSTRFTYLWQGVNWRFASASHRDEFKANPTRFAPEFGGYCSLAASLGRVADGDPRQWAIVEGKLFLNNNADAQAL